MVIRLLPGMLVGLLPSIEDRQLCFLKVIDRARTAGVHGTLGNGEGAK
jgi:hypothetical protein